MRYLIVILVLLGLNVHVAPAFAAEKVVRLTPEAIAHQFAFFISQHEQLEPMFGPALRSAEQAIASGLKPHHNKESLYLGKVDDGDVVVFANRSFDQEHKTAVTDLHIAGINFADLAHVKTQAHVIKPHWLLALTFGPTGQPKGHQPNKHLVDVTAGPTTEIGWIQLHEHALPTSNKEQGPFRYTFREARFFDQGVYLYGETGPRHEHRCEPTTFNTHLWSSHNKQNEIYDIHHHKAVLSEIVRIPHSLPRSKRVLSPASHRLILSEHPVQPTKRMSIPPK